MTKATRLVTAETRDDDSGETSLRPLTLDEFIGQDQARANLKVFIDGCHVERYATGIIVAEMPIATVSNTSIVNCDYGMMVLG